MAGCARKRITAAVVLCLGVGVLTGERPLLARTQDTAGVAAAPPAHGGAPRPSGGFTWWKDEGVQKELSLTAVQVKRLDDIYTRFETEVQPLVKEITAHDDELDALIAQARVDPRVVEGKARVVTALRAPLNAARITMLYRMSLVLTPAQRTGLATIMARRRNR